MVCPKCGSKVEDGRTYCPSCGETVRNVQPYMQMQNSWQMQGQNPSPYGGMTNGYQQSQQGGYNAPYMQGGQMPQGGYDSSYMAGGQMQQGNGQGWQGMYQPQPSSMGADIVYPYGEQFRKKDNAKNEPVNTLSVIGMSLGIFATVTGTLGSIMLGFVASIVAILCGVSGMVLGIMGQHKRRSGMGTAGIVCGIIGFSFGVIFLIGCIGCSVINEVEGIRWGVIGTCASCNGGEWLY